MNMVCKYEMFTPLFAERSAKLKPERTCSSTYFHFPQLSLPQSPCTPPLHTIPHNLP